MAEVAPTSGSSGYRPVAQMACR